MEKYYWFQITENCPNMSGKELDIRFRVSAGLTKKQAMDFEEAVNAEIEAYSDDHDGDFSEINYYTVLEKAAEKLGIAFEYPKVDYTISL